MRTAPADNWDDTLPTADRERYRAAWEAYRCCRDCQNWSCDDGDDVGACGLEKYAAFMTPEDYTCDQFEPRPKWTQEELDKSKRDAAERVAKINWD